MSIKSVHMGSGETRLRLQNKIERNIRLYLYLSNILQSLKPLNHPYT